MKVAVLSAIGKVFLSFSLGFLVGRVFDMAVRESLVLGTILSATSIGVSARTMLDLDVLRTDVGTAAISASIVDDILALILIVVVTGSRNIMEIGMNIILFFLVTIFIGLKLMKKIMKLGDQIHTTKALLSISIGICFIPSEFSDFTLSTAIVGAFLAGLFISGTVQSKRILKDVKAIGHGIFIPLFFIYVGASVDLGVFLYTDVMIFSVIVILAALAGKILGRGLGAVAGKFPMEKSFRVGVASVPRMEVALVALTVALKEEILTGEIADKLTAVTVILVLFTTILTPILLRQTFRSETGEVQTIKYL